MTSQKKWPLVITLLLILGLLLVACERPLPGDGSGDVPASEPPVSTDSGSYPEPDAGDTGAYPAPPVSEPGDGTSGYPAPGAELIPPVEEGDTSAKAYPAGEAAAGETSEGAAPEQETTEVVGSEGEAAAAGETTTEEPTAEGEIPVVSDGTAQPSGEKTHTVAAGENLYQIGLKYGISWVVIAQANDIVNPDTLTVGQVLIIPDVSESETPAATEDSTVDAAESSTTDTAASTETEEPAPAEGETAETIYVVQSGDNLYRISLAFGVNMMDVARANGLSNFDDITVGQELIIPGAASTAPEVTIEESTANEISHEVQEGETVFGIAFKYGIAWTKLVEKNNLTSPYTLEPGQVLLIPTEE